MKPSRDDPTAVGTSEMADAMIEKMQAGVTLSRVTRRTKPRSRRLTLPLLLELRGHPVQVVLPDAHALAISGTAMPGIRLDRRASAWSARVPPARRRPPRARLRESRRVRVPLVARRRRVVFLGGPATAGRPGGRRPRGRPGPRRPLRRWLGRRFERLLHLQQVSDTLRDAGRSSRSLRIDLLPLRLEKIRPGSPCSPL